MHLTSCRSLACALLFTTVAGAAGSARADEPIKLRTSWTGNYGFFSTGAALANDSNKDGEVDELAQPGKVMVTALDVAPGATLDTAQLYWGATQIGKKCEGDAHLDKEVMFSPPGRAAVAVAAEVCYCSASLSYDMQLCRANVTDLVGELTGEYSVDELDALIMNGDTNNASFGLVLVYQADALLPRRISLYDGLLALSESGTKSTTVLLDQITVSSPPQGDLTWYVLEGDTGGSTKEFVQAKALPGGGQAKLADPLNPANDPFNRTINTTVPPQLGVVGVDIDKFSLTPILEEGDDSLEITYNAGLDKYWIAFNIVGVDVFEPLFSVASAINWELTGDVGGDGEPSPGDTVTFTIHVENSGTAPGTVMVTNEIPAEAASWMLTDAGVGMDKSMGDTLIVDGIDLLPTEATDIVFELVLDDVPDLTVVVDTAEIDDGKNPVDLVAPDLVVRRDGDGDGPFDTDDNCPVDENPDQADSDDDGVGDVCEGAVSESDSGVTESGGTDSATDSGLTDSGATQGEGGESNGGTGTGGDSNSSVPTEGGGEDGVSASASASASDTATGDATGADSETDSAGLGNELDDEGCGCNGGGSPAGALLVVVGLAGVRRRRRA